MPGKIFPHFRLRRQIRLFKENQVFRGVSAWSDKNACVGENGGPYDLYDYAVGYFDATKGLLELVLAAPDVIRPWVMLDTLVYPICLNFRHAVELFIKYVITALAKRLNSKEQYRRSHSLEDNWATAQQLIKACGLQVTNDDIVSFSIVVSSIHEVDPKGEIFRYPESIKGDPHLKEWSLINLRLLDQYREIADRVAYRWHGLIER